MKDRVRLRDGPPPADRSRPKSRSCDDPFCRLMPSRAALKPPIELVRRLVQLDGPPSAVDKMPPGRFGELRPGGQPLEA